MKNTKTKIYGFRKKDLTQKHKTQNRDVQYIPIGNKIRMKESGK